MTTQLLPFNQASYEQSQAHVNLFEQIKEVVTGIRNVRIQKNIAQKEALELLVMGEDKNLVSYEDVVKKLCNLSSIEFVMEKPEGAASFMVGTTEYFVPLGGMINAEEELAKLEAELKYQEGFLQSVLTKELARVNGMLGNEKFVSKAPANVIDIERKKQADAESKIASLKENIAALKK